MYASRVLEVVLRCGHLGNRRLCRRHYTAGTAYPRNGPCRHVDRPWFHDWTGGWRVTNLVHAIHRFCSCSTRINHDSCWRLRSLDHFRRKSVEIKPAEAFGWSAFTGSVKYLYVLALFVSLSLAGLEATLQLFGMKRFDVTPLQVGIMFLVCGLVGA